MAVFMYPSMLCLFLLLGALFRSCKVRVGVPITRPEILTDTDSHTPRLRWSRVYTSPYDRADIPLRYRIEVQDLPRRSWRPLAQGLDMEEYSMKDLTPDRDYMFRIRAETPEGDVSEPTHPIPYYRSRESSSYERSPVPEYKPREQDYSVPTRTYVDHLTTFIPPRLPIDKPELYEAGPDSATLSWKPAKVPERIRNKTSLTYSVDVRTPPNHEWRELVSGLTSTSYTLTNLHPRLDYMFRVKAHNEYGCSEASLPASLFRPIEIEDEDLEYEGDDWEDEYRGTLSETVPPKLPMETPRITDHGETAMLHWHEARIPVYAKKTPITYIIEIKEPPIPGWSRFASGISDTNYFIENLLSNHDYQFRVRAETQFGVSDPTLPAVLDRTKEQVKESIEEFDYTIEDFVIKGSQKKEERRRQSISCLAHGEKIGYYQLKKMLSSISPNSSSQSSHDSLNHRHTSESGTYSRTSQPLYLPSDDDSDDDLDDVRGERRYRKNRKSYQSSSESHSFSRRTRHGYRAAERSQNVDMEAYESRVKTLYDSNRERLEKAHKLLREDAVSPTRSITSSYDAGRSTQSKTDISAAEDRYSLRKTYASLQAANLGSQRKTDEGISLITKTNNTSLSEGYQGKTSATSVDNEIGSYSPLLRKANALDTSDLSLKSSKEDSSISKSKSRPYTYLLSSSDEDEKVTDFKSKDLAVNTSRGVSSELYSHRSFTYLLSSSDEDDSDEREAKQQRLQTEKERKLTSEKLQHLTETLLLSDSDEKQSIEMRIRQKSKTLKYASFSESKITTDVEKGRQLFQTDDTPSASCKLNTTCVQQCEVKSSGKDFKNEIDETSCFETQRKTSKDCEVNIDQTKGKESEEYGCERRSDLLGAEGFEVQDEENKCCEMENKILETEDYGVTVEETQGCEMDNDVSRKESCVLKFDGTQSYEVDKISRTEGCVVKVEEEECNETDKICETGSFELKVKESKGSEIQISETECSEVKVEDSQCCETDNKISETEHCEVKVQGNQCCGIDNEILGKGGYEVKVEEGHCSEMEFKKSETEHCEVKVQESQCSEFEFKISETEHCEVKVQERQFSDINNKISEIERCEVNVEENQCCETDNTRSETEHCEVKVQESQFSEMDNKISETEHCEVKVHASQCSEMDNKISETEHCEIKVQERQISEMDNTRSETQCCEVKVEENQCCETENTRSETEHCEVKVQESQFSEMDNKISETEHCEIKVQERQISEMDNTRSETQCCEVKVEESQCCEIENTRSETEHCEVKVQESQFIEMNNEISETQCCEVKVEESQCCEIENARSETGHCDVKVKGRHHYELDNKISETGHCEVKVEGFNHCCETDNDISRAKGFELKVEGAQCYETEQISGTEGCVVKVEGRQSCEMSETDSCGVEVDETQCYKMGNKTLGTKKIEVNVEGNQCCEKDTERSIGCEVKVDEKHCHQTEITTSGTENVKVEESSCCELERKIIYEGDSQILQSRLNKNVVQDHSTTSIDAAEAEISNEFRQSTFLSSDDNSGPKTCYDEQSYYKEKVMVDKSKQSSYLLSSSDEDESASIPRRPSVFDQYSHLLLSSDSDEEGLTSKGRRENRPYRSFLEDRASYEKLSRSRASQIDSTSRQDSEASETNMAPQRRFRSIRKLSSKQNAQTSTVKQTTCDQNGNIESESMTGKTRRPSLDKKSDLELPQTVYLESLVAGVPPRMSSSRPLITNQIGSHLTLSWLPGRVPSYVKGSHMSYIVEVRQPPSYQWNVLVDDLEECEFDVYDLLPDQDYMFRIRARNEFGLSDPTMPASVIRSRDDYTGPTHTSRSASRDSLGSPWMRSRASSVDSITKQWSFDEDYDVHPIRNAAPEFRPSEDTFYGAQSRPMRINLQVRGFPLPNITWSHKGKKLGKRYKSYITPSGHVTLEIPDVTEDNVGEYKCCAENEEGVAVRKFTLELADPPTFLEPMKDIVVDLRGGGKFECRIDGIPYPSVKWMKDWRPLAESSRIHVRHVAPDYWCLELGGAIGLDAGLYTCVAENPAGKAVSSAQLSIEDRPPKPMGLHFRQSRVEDYYYILEELGRGRHGVVRRVIDKSSGREFAAKFIPVSDPHHKYFFRQELENLRGVSHKNILEVTDAFQSNWGLVIISELINGGELLDRVVSLENWMESDVAHYVHQVLKAIKHLHGTGVLHLDIKPSNIHLNNSVSDEIKLIDFGLSRRLYPDMLIKHNYGTPDYTSPEQINNDPLTHAADIWSTGTLAYLLLSGISPFHADSDKETLRRVQSCDWCFDDDAFKSVSKEAKDFISKLLVLDPSERLTIDECLEHPWIKNSSTRGQGASLDLDRLDTFHDAELKRRRQGYLQRCARIQSLQSILKGESEPDPVLHPFKDSSTGNLTFPDSDVFGKFLDEESWADWQTRNHQGGDTVLAPLIDGDYTSRIKGYKSATSGEGETSGTEEMMKERCDLFDLEKEHVTFDPSHEIEAEWLVVAEDFKQRTSAKELFPSAEQDSAAGPLFISKLQNQTYMPGDTITLSCHVTGHNANVSWYRNEESISDGSRLRTVFSDDGRATLTIQSSKPYDEGLYKCVARNREGRTTTWSRVQVGGVSEQPGGPVVTEVSSSDVLLVWEPPVSLSNTSMLGYRVDYRLTGHERWQTAAYVIDECCLVSDLLPGKTYRFRVCCYNQYGYSPYSFASHEVKTLTSGGSIRLDSYTQALLARQRDVDRYPTPPTSRQGSEPSPQSVTILESSPDSSYDVLNSVYSGGFADLKCCKMPESSALYLAKIIPTTDAATYRREYDILHTLRHERIVGLYGTYLYKERFYLILEFLYGLNVAQHFAYKTRYTEDMVAYVIRQILDGVQYLHYVGVTHLNLQPSSIVMVSRRRSDIKIVDFSLARSLPRTGELVPRQGNPAFMAPEVVTGEMTSKSADIWTIGTLAFLLLSGVSPFEGETEEKIFSNIAYNRYRAHSLYENVTREALKFVFQVLKRTPRRRLTVDQCLEDKWLHVTDVMSKARQEKVFTTVSLRNFTRRYFKKRVLQMYPIIEQEVTSSVATDDMEDLEEPSLEKEGTSQPIISENVYEPGEAQLEEMASTLVTTAIDAALHSSDIKST